MGVHKAWGFYEVYVESEMMNVVSKLGLKWSFG